MNCIPVLSLSVSLSLLSVYFSLYIPITKLVPPLSLSFCPSAPDRLPLSCASALLSLRRPAASLHGWLECQTDRITCSYLLSYYLILTDRPGRSSGDWNGVVSQFGCLTSRINTKCFTRSEKKIQEKILRHFDNSVWITSEKIHVVRIKSKKKFLFSGCDFTVWAVLDCSGQFKSSDH